MYKNNSFLQKNYSQRVHKINFFYSISFYKKKKKKKRTMVLEVTLVNHPSFYVFIWDFMLKQERVIKKDYRQQESE